MFNRRKIENLEYENKRLRKEIESLKRELNENDIYEHNYIYYLGLIMEAYPNINYMDCKFDESHESLLYNICCFVGLHKDVCLPFNNIVYSTMDFLNDNGLSFNSDYRRIRAMIEEEMVKKHVQKEDNLEGDIVLKMNDVELGRVAINSLKAFANHGGEIDLPL